MSDSFHTIPVELGTRSYPIYIGNGILPMLVSVLQDVGKGTLPQCFIVSDSNVAALYAERVESLLKDAGIVCHTIVVPASEHAKSFAILEQVLNNIFVYHPDRHCCLIALGGGVVGDLTGFAASILLRGVPFIQIPTTLLSQVDSSVGGKTGINNHFGKNLVGTFYQPHAVLIDIALLSTLSQRQLRSGYAEVVKYAFIQDKDFFTWLDANKDAIQARDAATLIQCISKSCQAKAAIVAEDEKETGKRALLNLGHTFGHALEVETGYSDSLLHGEAVSIGTVLAYQFSAQLGLCKQDTAKQVKEHLQAMGLPVSLLALPTPPTITALLHHMYQDKKRVGNKLVFILARDIGDCFVAKDIDPLHVHALLESHLHLAKRT